MKLELSNIGKSYDESTILDGISFTFYSGNIYILKGKNGAGKSTLLNILSGNDINHSGKMKLDGDVINENNIISYVDDHVSYLTQDSIVFDDVTCLDNILYPYIKKDKEKASNLLKLVGLEDCKDQNASTLSYGEKQRLAFARSLYESKEIILLDEITSGLDAESENIIDGLISNLSSNHIIIFVTHEDSSSIKNSIDLTLEDKRLKYEDKEDKETEIKHDDVGSNPSLIKEVGSSIKNNKSLYITSSILIILLTFISIIFGGFYKTFSGDGMKQITYQNYLNSTPALYLDNLDSINEEYFDQYTEYLVECESNIWPSAVKKDSPITGILSVTDTDFPKYGLSLAIDDDGNEIGSYPSNESELLISRFTFDEYVTTMKESGSSYDETVDSLFDEQIFGAAQQYRISGVYEPVTYDDFESHINATLVTARLSYTFMITTGFTIHKQSNVGSNKIIVKNTINNRNLITINNMNDFMINNKEDNELLWTTTININKNGEYPYSSLDAYMSWQIFMYVTYALLLILIITITISFYTRNNRLFLLLRVSGMSRDRQVRNTILGWTTVFVTSMLLGLSLESLLQYIIVKILSSTMTNPCILPLTYYWQSFVIPLAIVSLSCVSFALVVSYMLSPRDLTKKINLIKGK